PAPYARPQTERNGFPIFPNQDYEVVMLKTHSIASYLLAMLLLAGSFSLLPASALAQSDSAQQRAIDWIKDQQQDDGAFPGFGPGDTADVVMALVAAGENHTKLIKAGKSPL